jgi:hypothetical protein
LGELETLEGEKLDVREALRAIGSTSKGRCWYCDLKLPRAEVAMGAGWDVRRLNGERVASVILVCPMCRRDIGELGEEEFLRNLSLRVCNATC